MLKRGIASAAIFLLSGSVPALAQTPRVEVSAFAGWVFSDGVDGDPALAGDGNFYDTVDPKDGALFGLTFGVLATDNVEVGFQYHRQQSTLQLDGTAQRELGDLAVSTYHGYVGYNFGEADAPARPFLLFGLGLTNFSSVDVTVAGVNRSIPGESQFSTTWGGGVKFFPAPGFGVRVAALWTPTYIKSDAAGWWCDPYWGCYLVGDPQYSNQFGFTGGVTIRF
jgi:hypothetical protein